MKKILLSLATVAMAAAPVLADTVTYDFVTNDYGLTRTSDNNAAYVTDANLVNGDVTLKISKTEGNGYRLWNDGLRVMNTKNGKANLQVVVADAKVTEIVIERTTNNTPTSVSVKIGRAYV